MFTDINGGQIHYRCSGEGKDVILLHGWGANIDTLAPIHRHLEPNFRVWSIDFPGCGKSPEPKEPWSIDDYTSMLEQFIKNHDIQCPILIGHSHGGRVSIRYAAGRDVHKIILVDSAGIKPKRKLKNQVKVYTYKTSKALLNLPGLKSHKEKILTRVKKKLGSTDYQNASGVMQQTLVKVVNEDLRHYMPKISVPTLLVWGEHDDATPVSDAKIMEEMIPDAGLVVLKGAGHYAYLDNLQEFLVILNHFLDKDKEARTSHE
ncbi:alpha/beta hydrolase [Salicibibacter cibi]|uniref:Alpha/beta hydrolase n=1 Tax=Salicibibacter cibi TaxID=2743001 RepID=A0A7T6ZE52_9BACI|nr:alpha/beta hydrolase [Salicibibacter cibi]